MAIDPSIVNIGRSFQPAASVQQGFSDSSQNRLNQLIQRLKEAEVDAIPRQQQRAEEGFQLNRLKQIMDIERSAESGYGPGMPSSLQEFQAFEAMDPERQRQFLSVKRATPIRDIGGSFATFDPITSAPTIRADKTLPPGQRPQAIEEKKIAEATGKAVGEARIALPQVQADAEYTTALLDQLVRHPGKKYATGGASVLPVVPGTSQADFIALHAQIGGKQFLQAYQSLRGGGQITEIEGVKAEQAIARMNRNQTGPAFDKAANEFKMIIKKGLERAKKEAKMGGRVNRQVPADPDTFTLPNGVAVKRVQ